jgi:hypothetical protein
MGGLSNLLKLCISKMHKPKENTLIIYLGDIVMFKTFEETAAWVRERHALGYTMDRTLTRYVNDADIDVRIAAKKLAKELRYAIIPVNVHGEVRLDVLPTKGMLEA